ncbi:MAG: radical SAM/SPASM domain-containing protein [Vicinamibacterales bacterium]
MSVPLLGLAADIIAANFDRRNLPYKVTLVATYHCNFRCEMCSIWQKDSVGEMTPAEVESFFGKWSQFSWVHLTGGELFMRRDLEDLVTAIVDCDRSLYLLNFPTTGWFGDRTVALVERILKRGIGRLMTTISIDGPPDLHDAMRGLPGSWERGIETLRRLRAIDRRNFQVVAGMTLFTKNAARVDDTIAAIRAVVPDFERTDLHLNIGHESAHYFSNRGYLGGAGPHPVAEAIEAHRAAVANRLHPVRFLEDRYQALVGRYYETHKSPLPCAALSSSCFIDPYWRLYPCSIWDESLGNLREQRFDLLELWRSKATRDAREAVVNEQCPHCWTPCEAYPTILGNLARAVSPSTPRRR